MSFLHFYVFIVGLTIGSFINSLIYLLECKGDFVFKEFFKRKSILGRSFCPKCRHTLSIFDLVPILSFVSLGGRCRYCSEKISWQYPLVELATGVLFLLIYIFSEPVSLPFNFLQLLYLFILFSILLIIFVYDLKHYLIPDAMVYFGSGLVFTWRFFESIINPNKLSDPALDTILNPVLSALIFSFFFWFVVFLSKEKWLGKGDIGLVFLVGLILGWPKILAALFLSFVLGAIIGIGLIVLKKKTLKSEIPFGPFLITGTFVALFWGEKLINFYLSLIK